MCRDSIKIYLSSIENISVTLQGIVWGSVFHAGMRVQLKGTRQQQHSHTHTHTCTHAAQILLQKLCGKLKKLAQKKHCSRRIRCAVKESQIGC